MRNDLLRWPAVGGVVAPAVAGRWHPIPAPARVQLSALADVGRVGTDDVTMFVRDSADGVGDELGTGGTGMYRLADAGARYTQAEMPSDPGLFDNNTSVAIFTDVPADAAPPTYPSPA